MDGINGYQAIKYDAGYSNYYGNFGKNEQTFNAISGKEADEEKTIDQEKQDKRLGKEECETCKNRKYQDGSDENVSFKAAAHISPDAAASRVRGHEQEHVSNAYDKAAQSDGKVINASVTIHTAICPECGRSYVSGGETVTQIMYKQDNKGYNNNPDGLKGRNFDQNI